MNEDAIRDDKYAKSLLDKDILSFWKHIRKSNNARVPLATTIGGITCENDIAEMFQDHYKSILNSVKTNSRQQLVKNKLSSIRRESIFISTSDINVALHSLKVAWMVLLQNISYLRIVLLMCFYLYHLTLLFFMVICLLLTL